MLLLLYGLLRNGQTDSCNCSYCRMSGAVAVSFEA